MNIIDTAIADPAAERSRGKKHEISVAAFGDHLFMSNSYRARGSGHGPLGHLSGCATVSKAFGHQM